jgi:glutamine cyclotransferase
MFKSAILVNRFLRLLRPGFIAVSTVVLVLLCLDCRGPETSGIYTYKVINTFAHDKQAFTQGLAFDGGFLYEGTGLLGHSTLRKVELKTGNILQMHKLPAEFFGEGITVYRDKIIQLTLEKNVGFVYDKYTFELLRKFNYPTEGWGITHDGNRLIMSDGSATLYFLSPDTFELLGQIEVRDESIAVQGLNELEYVKGEVYANIWPTENIVRIDPITGELIGWINMAGLRSQLAFSQQIDVLNGIAYDAAGDRLFVTGKLYPKIFEIKLVPLKQ